MNLKAVALFLGMAIAGAASAEQSDKLFIQGDLVKEGVSVIHFANWVRSDSDMPVSTLIKGSYLNEVEPGAHTLKLVPWEYVTGAFFTLNAMLAGDGSILLSIHGMDSSVAQFKGTEKNPELLIPELILTDIKAREILDEGKQGEVQFGHCKVEGKHPSDCEYTLYVTVTKR